MGTKIPIVPYDHNSSIVSLYELVIADFGNIAGKWFSHRLYIIQNKVKVTHELLSDVKVLFEVDYIRGRPYAEGVNLQVNFLLSQFCFAACAHCTDRSPAGTSRHTNAGTYYCTMVDRSLMPKAL